MQTLKLKTCSVLPTFCLIHLSVPTVKPEQTKTAAGKRNDVKSKLPEQLLGIDSQSFKFSEQKTTQIIKSTWWECEQTYSTRTSWMKPIRTLIRSWLSLTKVNSFVPSAERREEYRLFNFTGLRSTKTGEQCEAIIRFPKLFEKYPFPILINSSFLKLAEFFRIGWVLPLRYPTTTVSVRFWQHVQQLKVAKIEQSSHGSFSSIQFIMNWITKTSYNHSFD